MRSSIQNEYYWFSKQPHKQYLLGVQRERNGEPRACYSQGVGASELAKSYAFKGNRRLFLKWAKVSENAWLKFFKVDSKWFNSYMFYAKVLGFQGKQAQMKKALLKSSKISGISIKSEMFTSIEREVCEALKLLVVD